jgi:transposase
VQAFIWMVHQRQGERLDAWLEQVQATQIPELVSFVGGIKRDKEAVVAGLTRPESNDHVAYCTSSLGSRSL